MTTDTMPDLSLSDIERRLRRNDPYTIEPAVAPERAAVAAILRFVAEVPEVLLMKRVKAEGDRWSGHVSFPGGRAEPSDPDLFFTATRETWEEVGLDLDRCARFLGRLDDVQAQSQGNYLPMAISPFVFLLTAPAEIRLGEEAEATLWLPLLSVLSGELSDVMDYQLGPNTFQLPCWRFQGYTIWGLTYRMIVSFLQTVEGRPLVL